MHLQVKVKPNAKQQSFEFREDGIWSARLKSSPVDGKANQELIELIAQHFHCPKSSVRIKSGGGSRLKLIEITSDIPFNPPSKKNS